MIGPPWWDDATVFIVGGGPSLAGFDFSRLRGKGHVLGVNQAMFDMLCDAGVSIDHVFIKNNVDRLSAVALLHPLYLVLGDEWQKSGVPDVPGAIYIRAWHVDGRHLCFDPNFIRRGPTSGFTALNLAILKHARKIVLLGFDYRVDGDRSHYHDDYPWHHKANDQSWSSWVRVYNQAASECRERGIEVINTSMLSAIDDFPKAPLDEVIDAH